MSIQFNVVVGLALGFSGAVACTGNNSTGGSGGQSNGGSNTGGASATSGGAGGASAVSGGAGGSGATCEPAGTLTVTNDGVAAYVINGTRNPDLTLCRMTSYTFAINAPGHPFYIKTVQGAGTANAYETGVLGNGATTSNVTFTVATDAPNTLFYNCSVHATMTGTLHIVD